jgi:hypothetical protein
MDWNHGLEPWTTGSVHELRASAKRGLAQSFMMATYMQPITRFHWQKLIDVFRLKRCKKKLIDAFRL